MATATPPKITGKLFIVYDGRARYGDTAAAQVLCTARSLKEAKRDVRTGFGDGVIFSYDSTDRDELINERQETF